MNEIIHQAHRFLQNFCRGNPANQKLLHENLSLFMQSGETVSCAHYCEESRQVCCTETLWHEKLEITANLLN